MSRDKAEVTAKVRRLERQRDNGVVIKPGRAWTVERWLTHWLENIAKPSVRYKPYIGYRTAVNRHLIPGLGATGSTALSLSTSRSSMPGC